MQLNCFCCYIRKQVVQLWWICQHSFPSNRRTTHAANYLTLTHILHNRQSYDGRGCQDTVLVVTRWIKGIRVETKRSKQSHGHQFTTKRWPIACAALKVEGSSPIHLNEQLKLVANIFFTWSKQMEIKVPHFFLFNSWSLLPSFKCYFLVTAA